MGHHSAEFLSTRDILEKMVRIAARLADIEQHEEDGMELFNLTNEIRGRSLFASGPDNTLMGDMDYLITDHFKAKYAVIGGMALAIHGTPRMTEDIDAIVAPFPDNSLTYDKEAMRAHRFYPQKSSTGTVIQLVHTKGGGIELLAVDNPMREYALENAETYSLLGHKVPVIPADALVGMKVLAYSNNPKRTEKDRMDALSVLTKSKPSMKKIRPMLNEEQNKEVDGLLAAVGLSSNH